MNTELRFIDQEISSLSGVSIFKKMMGKSEFVTYLETLPLLEQGYPPVQLFIQFMSAIWCGADRTLPIDYYRLEKGK